MAEEATPSMSNAATGGEPPVRHVALQKVYLQDASLEVPLAPQIFGRPWQPQLDVNVATQVQPMGQDIFHQVLSVTVTAKLGNDTAFLVEVQQAGLFLLQGFPSEVERGAVLGGYCPGILFPFAREAVSDLVTKAGFPQLLLQPINFEALYIEHLNRARAEAGHAEQDAEMPVLLN